MKAAPYMKLYVADYLADTTHLNTLEHGAYLLLLLALWRAGGKLPRDDRKLARIAQMSDAEWAEIAPTVIEFFTINGGVITQKRCSEELAKYEAVVNGSKRGGKASAAKRSNENNAEAPTDVAPMAQPKVNQPEPEPKIEEANASLVGSEIATAGLFDDEPVAEPVARPKPWDTSEAFTAFWSALPKTMQTRAGKKAKVWPEWKAVAGQNGEARLLAALKRYLAEDADVGRTGGPGAHLWLKEGKWEHWLPATGAAQPNNKRFPDETIRAAVAGRLGDDFARKWLDPCGWDDSRKVIVSPMKFIAEQLAREASALKSLGIASVRIAQLEAA